MATLECAPPVLPPIIAAKLATAIRSSGFDLEIDFYHDDQDGQHSLVFLTSHSRARESISGIIAGACLCELTRGELTEAGETIQASAVIARARQFEVEFQPLIADEIAEETRAAPAPVRSWWKFW